MEQHDCIAILKEYASARKKRIQPCQVCDANVCSSIIDQSTGWVPRLISGQLLSHQIHMTYRRRRVRVAANEEYISLQVEGRLDAEVCSINRVNRVSFVNQPSELTVGGDSRWPVFLPRNYHASGALSSFLDSPALLSAVELIIQSPEDSLHCFKDAILVYFRPASAEDLQSAIESLSRLVGPKNRVRRDEFSSLPREFDSLIPLIQEWAEGDDDWREEMLRRASKPTLAKLIETVSPYLTQINDYLDANDDEAACALGRLAEVAVEARLEIGNRKT
jgi:hypothetical protein